ncbi:MAG: hypothetical protein IJ817_01140 [Clostridia bacterium]|nr:hypothetical protein [Clostridia bacterium]
MKKFVKNLLLYISAFVPMYVLVFVKLVVEIINHNLHFNVLNTINLITLLFLIVSGSVGLFWNIKMSKEKSVKVRILYVKNITDHHFLGYFSLFVFFAIPLDLSLVSAYCVYILVLIMIGIVYINNALYYINPLLNILGYSFYDVSYKEVESEKRGEIKLFCKEKLIPNSDFYIKIKNEHFCFIDKKQKIDVQ